MVNNRRDGIIASYYQGRKSTESEEVMRLLIKVVKAEINMEILYARKRNCLISKKY